MAWFPGEQPGNPRVFHPANLPAHDSAFAMIVYNAQESELDEVWLVLPVGNNLVLSRELVYTSMTRACRALHLVASEPAVRDALPRDASWWTGLGRRLGSQAVENAMPDHFPDTGKVDQPAGRSGSD